MSHVQLCAKNTEVNQTVPARWEIDHKEENKKYTK